jgi:NodT family efflux transporter outer membrane factor (OMF) lipoprotein
LKTLISAILLSVLLGCSVGPDFEPPAAPGTDRYTPTPLDSSGPVLKVVPSAALPEEWWKGLGSAEIDGLVVRALEHSPTLVEAKARLTQARELLTARTGATQYPSLDASFGAKRQRIDPATFGFPQAPNPGVFNVFSLGAEASYTFDIFGGSRRELEALAARVDYEGFQTEAARLTLVTNVVVTAIRLASLESRIEATSAILAFRREEHVITQGRLDLGAVPRSEVERKAELVAEAEANLPPLRAQREQSAHLLAVFLGEAPGTAVLPILRLADFKLPGELPLILPADLVRRRPDVRASEALIHEACANVGVATADLYPKLVLSGSVTPSSLRLPDLFSNGINVWSVGANLMQPIFHGGELTAKRRAAIAAYEQAGASYQQVVLEALRNVADTLRTLEADAQAYRALSARADRMEEEFRIANGQFGLGGVSRLTVLEAERKRREAIDERLQSFANRCGDVAALYQALGGAGIREIDGKPSTD